jgi:hypothetical protein
MLYIVAEHAVAVSDAEQNSISGQVAGSSPLYFPYYPDTETEELLKFE